MKKLVAIVAGDPDSINTELIAKVWKKKSIFFNVNIFVVGNFGLIKKQFKNLKIKIKSQKINELNNKNFKKKLLIFDVPFNSKKIFNISKKVKSEYVLKSLNIASNLAKQNKIAGFINCPINKDEVFYNKNYGVTEFLAKKNNVLDSVSMLIYNKELSVSPITTHIKLKEVSAKINKKTIVDKLITINNFYIKKFKTKPKIGIIGLNPHNFELRKNSEEKTLIIPAIKKLKKRGLNIKGPLPADTAFIDYKKKGFNVFVGMYHDQVLAPFKALFKFNAINITLGLPFIRISPDHGTSRDIIGKNKANPTSLIQSIKFFQK